MTTFLVNERWMDWMIYSILKWSDLYHCTIIMRIWFRSDPKAMCLNRAKGLEVLDRLKFYHCVGYFLSTWRTSSNNPVPITQRAPFQQSGFVYWKRCHARWSPREWDELEQLDALNPNVMLKAVLSNKRIWSIDPNWKLEYGWTSK